MTYVQDRIRLVDGRVGPGNFTPSEMQPHSHAPPAAVAYCPYSGSEG
jgi:hypothetical protein